MPVIVATINALIMVGNKALAALKCTAPALSAILISDFGGRSFLAFEIRRKLIGEEHRRLCHLGVYRNIG